MNGPFRSSVALLAIAGLASALFAVMVGSPGLSDRVSVGLTFGIAIAAYFVWYEGFRDLLKTAVFVCACTAAWPTSVAVAEQLMRVIPGVFAADSSKAGAQMPIFFGAGCVGAFVILAAGIFLFGRRRSTGKSLAVAALWSLGGGFLGVIGAALGMVRTSGATAQMPDLFLVWQPGAAILLGLLLEQERRAVAEPSLPSESARKGGTATARRDIGVAVVVLIAGLLALLGWYLYGNIQSRRIAANRAAIIARAPSLNDLRDVEPVAPEQVLILREIAGLYPWYPMWSGLRGGNRGGRRVLLIPPKVDYSVGYTATSYAPGPGVPRIANVNVTEYPNADWARYSAEYPQREYSEPMASVKKDGQTVLEEHRTRGGVRSPGLCFLWPSESFAVSVCYGTADIREELTRQYLEKYPSSL